MFWLFALGIIWLTLTHDGFRKFVFWTAGVVAALFVVAILVNRPNKSVTAEQHTTGHSYGKLAALKDDIPAECMKDREAFFNCETR